MTNYQQPQPYAPVPNKPPRNKKQTNILVGVIAGVALLPLLAVGIAGLALKAQQDARNDEINSRVDYINWGGLATDESQIDSHLQRRLDDQTEYVNTMDSNFDVLGVFYNTRLTDTDYDHFNGPLPTDESGLKIESEIKLAPEADFNLVKQTIIDYWESRGFTLTDDSISGSEGSPYSTLIFNRDEPLKDSSVLEQGEQIQVHTTSPFDEFQYYSIAIWDKSDKAIYKLANVPVWSGAMVQSEYKETYAWIYESGPHPDEICALPQGNTFYGYWDEKYGCRTDLLN